MTTKVQIVALTAASVLAVALALGRVTAHLFDRSVDELASSRAVRRNLPWSWPSSSWSARRPAR